MRFYDFTVVKMSVVVFWVMMPCSFVHRYNVSEELSASIFRAWSNVYEVSYFCITSLSTVVQVVDSRARNLVDGSVHQRQRKQLEVFQAQVPGGSLQVIRTQSVTSTSSSSCSWRAPLHSDTNVPTDFENIQVCIVLLKSKNLNWFSSSRIWSSAWLI